MMRALFLVLIFGLVAPAGVASARDATPDERAGLTEAIEDFDAAMRAKEYDRVTAVLSQRVLNHIADAADLDIEILVEMVGTLMAQTMAKAEGMTFSMDTDAIEYSTTSEERLYALVPTRMMMPMEGGSVKQESYTLSFLEDGEWRFLRVEDAGQIMVLGTVYPDFRGIEFPRGSLEALD